MESSSTNPLRSVTDNGGVHQLPLPSNLETLKTTLEQQRTENKGLHMLLEVTAKEKAYLQAAQKQFLQQKNVDITEIQRLRSELQQLRGSLGKKTEDNQNLVAKLHQCMEDLKGRKQIKQEIDDERQTLIDQKMKLCSEINRLTDEREELIEKHAKEREIEAMYSAKLVSTIKTIAANSGFKETGENISDGYLGRLQVHVQNRLKAHSEEKEELERRRTLMKSMFKTLQKEQRKFQEGNAQQNITVSSTSTDQRKSNLSQVSSEHRSPLITTSSKTTTQTPTLIKKEQPDEFDSGVTGAPPPSLTDLVESSSPVNPSPTDTLSTSQPAKNSTSPCRDKHEGPSRPTGSTTLNTQRKIPDNDVTVTAVTTEEPLLSSIPKRKLGFKGKQLTKFAVTSKPHGIYPNTRVFYCLCGSGPFGSRKNLLLHIAKMTKEWKYRCETCKYYFFYHADLKVHCKTSKCKPKPEITSVAQNPSAQFSPQATFVEELIGIPTSTTEAMKPKSKILPWSSLSMGSLQRKILKRHAPWNKDPVEGSWYCTCQKAYKTKHSLETHILTFTKDSKFKCRKPGCNSDFLYLGQLKQHLKSRHNVKKPLNGFSSGCHVCGKKFPSRRELFAHQKADHGYIRHRTQTGPQRLWLPTMSLEKLNEPQMDPRPKLASTRPTDMN